MAVNPLRDRQGVTGGSAVFAWRNTWPAATNGRPRRLLDLEDSDRAASPRWPTGDGQDRRSTGSRWPPSRIRVGGRL